MKLLMGVVCAWSFVIILMTTCASLIGTKLRMKHTLGKLGRSLNVPSVRRGLHEDIISVMGLISWQFPVCCQVPGKIRPQLSATLTCAEACRQQAQQVVVVAAILL